MPHPLTGPALGFASRLKFPTLFKLTLAIFILDLLVPDLIPFVDEILMGLTALILANWKKPAEAATGTPREPAVIEGESRRE
jgi:hypothetical protein